jgi:hypothetical protein
MKKTKTLFWLFLCIISFAFKSSAQEWYFGFGCGYGFPVAGQALVNNNYTAFTNNFTTQSLSYGKGINFGLYGGYLFNKYAGIDLGISVLSGINTTSTNTNSGNFTDVDVSEYSGNMVRLIPGIRFQCGEHAIHPYCVLGFIACLYNSATITDKNNTETYSGGYSYGFHGALGARIMLNEKFSFYIEFASYFQNYVPAKMVASPGGYETDFVNSGYNGYNTSSTQEPKIYLPFSSVGVNAGFQFSFVKAAKQAATPAPK